MLAEQHPRLRVISLSACLPSARLCPAPRAVADEEALPLKDASLDLVTSVLSLHLVNDLPGALVQIRRALRPDGLFLAALLGGDSLIELRQAFMVAETETAGGASPRVFPTADIRDMGGLLQRAGFALPVADTEQLTVTYADAFALMRELKAMGTANALAARSKKPLRRDTLHRAAQIYAERFGAGAGRVKATFEILYLSGWAPHESQQKPLKPGSAAARLADALGTAEIAAGDKAGFARGGGKEPEAGG
jgi:SAM-dependent methyltransferase